MLCYKHMGTRCNLIKRLESVFSLSIQIEREEQRGTKGRGNCWRENAEKAVYMFLWIEEVGLYCFVLFFSLSIKCVLTTASLRACAGSCLGAP